uniref:hypothetical protein n=1 Tax=Streptomyces sp. NRRL WC-3549 TaxID=1463925 RepID=UPI0004C7C33D
MGTQQVSASPCAPPGPAGIPAPASGVVHVNVRHTAGFTVIGNHLSRHRGLSLTAIGLSVHIQSLPAGAKVGIKHLAARFPESETRIAAALRELEAAGYLHRSRVRLPDGRVVTRTVSRNRPDAVPPVATERPGAPQPPPAPAPQPTAPTPAPAAPVPRPTPVSAPQTGAAPVPGPEEASAPSGPVAPARPEPPPLPRPRSAAPELARVAVALLADLRRHAPRLMLSERDMDTLAPGVVTWLERGARPEAVRHALTADLPDPLKHPAGLLRHRITTLLPPPLPGDRDLAVPTPPRAAVVPLQNCDRCDRAFRSRHPGHCRDCRDGHDGH